MCQQKRPGTALMEVLGAIVVTVFLVTLSFSLFTRTNQGFERFGSLLKEELLLNQQQIERNLSSVGSGSPSSITVTVFGETEAASSQVTFAGILLSASTTNVQINTYLATEVSFP